MDRIPARPELGLTADEAGCYDGSPRLIDGWSVERDCAAHVDNRRVVGSVTIYCEIVGEAIDSGKE
jgi:hypothetical protein